MYEVELREHNLRLLFNDKHGGEFLMFRAMVRNYHPKEFRVVTEEYFHDKSDSGMNEFMNRFADFVSALAGIECYCRYENFSWIFYNKVKPGQVITIEFYFNIFSRDIRCQYLKISPSIGEMFERLEL